MRSHIERDPPRRGPREVWREAYIRDADAVAMRVDAMLHAAHAGKTLTGATVGGIAASVRTVVDDAMPPGTIMLVKGNLAEVGPAEVIVDAENGVVQARMRLRSLDTADVVVMKVGV